MELLVKKSIWWGIGGAVLLTLFYWLVLTLANSLAHAVEQWRQWWFWIALLVIGFGSQVGLYSYIRYALRERKMKGVGREVVAAGGVSAGSMVACCAHHLVDVLPIIGVSAAAVFLVEYQLFFIIVGVVSNAVGIVYLLEVIKKHVFYKEGGVLGRLAQFDVAQLRRWAIIGAILVLAVVFMRTQEVIGQRKVVAQDVSAIDEKVLVELSSVADTVLSIRTDVGGGLTIEATPIDVELRKPIQFDISLNTHQGDLNFDLVEQSVLIDDAGNEYSPIEWQGERSGHHVSGKLIFPPLNGGANGMTLIISDVYEVAERVFEWTLAL